MIRIFFFDFVFCVESKKRPSSCSGFDVMIMCPNGDLMMLKRFVVVVSSFSVIKLICHGPPSVVRSNMTALRAQLW